MPVLMAVCHEWTLDYHLRRSCEGKTAADPESLNAHQRQGGSMKPSLIPMKDCDLESMPSYKKRCLAEEQVCEAQAYSSGVETR